MQTQVANLKIDAVTKREFLDTVGERIRQNRKTWVSTLYSEFLYHALVDRQTENLLNQADVAVADGIAMFWAKRYLELPLTVKNYWLKLLQACGQMIYSGAAILLRPQWIATALPEKIAGSDLVWDIAKLAAEHSYSIYLLGGFAETPSLVAQKLTSRYSTLIISGYSNKHPNDPAVIADIQKAKPDILLVAYGPLKQEQWICDHRETLPAKLYIGLGGTFDYLAGKRKTPPALVRRTGLEWLWRLFTQPHRWRRILNATLGLMTALLRYKVFMSSPFRRNVASVIINPENKLLLCKRNPDDPTLKKFGIPKTEATDHWQFPQGGMEPGETVEQTAKRECHEELGIKNLEFIKTSPSLHRYYWHNSRRPLLRRQSPYKGQEQHIAYLRFSGADSEIQLDSIEFTDFKWVTLNDLKQTIHPLRMPVADIVERDLRAAP